MRLPRGPMLAWGVFVAWVAVAAVVGVDPRLAWVGTPQRHFGALTWMLCALMFVVGHRLDDDGDARVVVAGAALTGGVAGAWCVAELCGWEPVALAGGDRLLGPLGSAAYLGAAMALLVPIAAGIAADATWPDGQRWVAAGCTALGVVGLIGSGARAAWVGEGGAAIVVLVARRQALRHLLAGPNPNPAPNPGPGGERGRALWRAGLVAVAAGGALVGLAFATGTADRVPEAFESGQPGGLSRLAEWNVAVRVLWEHPLTGVGPEGYRIVFGRAVSAEYQRHYGSAVLPDRAHDSLLDVAVTTGFPGLLAYVAVLGCAGRLVWRVLRRGPPWLAGVAVGAVAYTLGALLLFPLAEVEPGLWLMIGLLSLRAVAERETVTVTLPRWASVAVGAVAAWSVVAGVRSVAADRQVKVALDDAGRGDGVAATAAARRAVRWDPTDIVVRLNAAEVDADAGTAAGLDQALAQIADGLDVSPRDPVLGEEGGTLRLQLAQLTDAPADWRAARADLLGLRRADPRNPQVLLQLGVADVALGDEAGAAGAWQAAAYLAPQSAAPDDDLALLYQRQGRRARATQAARAALAREPGDPSAAAILADPDATGISDGT